MNVWMDIHGLDVRIVDVPKCVTALVGFCRRRLGIDRTAVGTSPYSRSLIGQTQRKDKRPDLLKPILELSMVSQRFIPLQSRFRPFVPR